MLKTGIHSCGFPSKEILDWKRVLSLYANNSVYQIYSKVYIKLIKVSLKIWFCLIKLPAAIFKIKKVSFSRISV